MLKTPKLQLNKPEGTDVVNIADLNANMDTLDSEVTKVATTAVDGRMSKEDKTKLNGIAAGAEKNAVTSVAGKTGAVTLTGTDIPAGTTSARGTLQLSTSTTSTSTTMAATPSAVKLAMDKANEAFQSASNGKVLIGNAITGVDDQVVIPSNPTFQQLADAIGKINTGKKWASGIAIASEDRPQISYLSSDETENFHKLTVDGLGFKPTVIIAYHQETVRQSLTQSSATTYINSSGLKISREQFFIGGTSTDSQSTNWVMKTNSVFNVSNGGFIIPVYYYPSKPFNWIAYE